MKGGKGGATAVTAGGGAGRTDPMTASRNFCRHSFQSSADSTVSAARSRLLDEVTMLKHSSCLGMGLLLFFIFQKAGDRCPPTTCTCNSCGSEVSEVSGVSEVSEVSSGNSRALLRSKSVIVLYHIKTGGKQM